MENERASACTAFGSYHHQFRRERWLPRNTAPVAASPRRYCNRSLRPPSSDAKTGRMRAGFRSTCSPFQAVPHCFLPSNTTVPLTQCKGIFVTSTHHVPIVPPIHPLSRTFACACTVAKLSVDLVPPALRRMRLARTDQRGRTSTDSRIPTPN